MALNMLRGRSRDRTEPDESYEIGACDSQIIGCPVCSRPIEANAGRCPGCGTRLMIGVPYRRAGIFLGVGAVIGILVGGTTIGVAMSMARSSALPGSGALPTASGGPGTGPRASHPADAPLAALAALRQAVAIDARLATGVDALKASLATKPFESFAVASTLRALASDAAVGADAADRMRPWTSAGDVSGQLATVYDEVRATARDALANGLANTSAYKSAATRMIAVLALVPAADAAARDLAISAGIEVSLPVASP